jgi:Na+/H+-translocating membrane pyrophosphatase
MIIAELIDLQTYQEKPDYARCVSIVASASLREMIKPGALAVISPIVIGNEALSCC